LFYLRPLTPFMSRRRSVIALMINLPRCLDFALTILWARIVKQKTNVLVKILILYLNLTMENKSARRTPND
jgi:hypothetical protein